MGGSTGPSTNRPSPETKKNKQRGGRTREKTERSIGQVSAVRGRNKMRVRVSPSKIDTLYSLCYSTLGFPDRRSQSNDRERGRGRSHPRPRGPKLRPGPRLQFEHASPSAHANMPNNNEPIWLGRPNGHLFIFRKLIFFIFFYRMDK